MSEKPKKSSTAAATAAVESNPLARHNALMKSILTPFEGIRAGIGKSVTDQVVGVQFGNLGTEMTTGIGRTLLGQYSTFGVAGAIKFAEQSGVKFESPVQAMLSGVSRGLADQHSAFGSSIVASAALFAKHSGVEFESPVQAMLTGISRELLDPYSTFSKGVMPDVTATPWTLAAGARISRDWFSHVENLDLESTDLDEEFREFSEKNVPDDANVHDANIQRLADSDQLQGFVRFLTLEWPPKTQKERQALAFLANFAFVATVAVGLVGAPHLTVLALAGYAAMGQFQTSTAKWSQQAVEKKERMNDEDLKRPDER